MTASESIETDLHGIPVRVAQRNQFDRQFWTRWMPAGWEADTFDFVRRHVVPGSVFLDIGAWIGPISLYAAGLGARVIALEPDPVSIASLRDNARLNAGQSGSVDVLHTAFDARPGTIRIFGNHKGFGTSGSSSVGLSWRAIRLKATTADDLIAMVGSDRPVTIKVDIEAHEYFCAGELARLRDRLDAVMHLSLHPFLLRKAMRWRRLTGTADAEIRRRTREVLAAFEGCDFATTGHEGVLHLDAIERILLPEDGTGSDVGVIIRGRGA